MAKFVLIAITAFLTIFTTPALASSFSLHRIFNSVVSSLGLNHSNEHVSKVTFGYRGLTGPKRWADLNPEFSQCAEGKSQSPVNILTNSSDVVPTEYKPLLVHYAKSINSTLINFGFNVGIRYGDEAGVIVLDGKNYTLRQMHWHTPSEHLIDGVRFAAELHLIHFAVDDHTPAVIAVLFQLDQRPDPTLSKIRNHLIKLRRETSSSKEKLAKAIISLGRVKQQKQSIKVPRVKSSSKEEQPRIPLGQLNTHQIRKLLHSHKYYKYVGSLTTPPCTEHVTWVVLAEIHTISKRQIRTLRDPLEPKCKKNSRPVQPLYGRPLQLYEA